MSSSLLQTSFLMVHFSANILEVTPSIGFSLAGYISNKINSSAKDKLSANSAAKSAVLEKDAAEKQPLFFCQHTAFLPLLW